MEASGSLLSPLADLVGIGSDQPVWGIDPSTHRFALGIIRPGDGVVVADTFHRGDDWCIATTSLPRGDMGPRRWGPIHRRLRDFFTAVIFATGEPVFVLIETPFSRPGKGRNSVHPESFYAVGVGCAALESVVACPIDSVGPSEWKKPALGEGRGNAKKPQILAWARGEMGYTGECDSCGNVPGGVLTEKCDKPRPAHDEADALAISVASARRLAANARVIG